MVNFTSNSHKQWAIGVLGTLLISTAYQAGGVLIAFALLALPLAATMAVRISGLFLVLFILFSYFRLHEAFPVLMPFKFPKLFALASIVGIAWHLIVTQRLQPHWHSSLLIFAMMFGWLTVSTFMAINTGLAIAYWSGTLTKVFIMVYAISWWIRDEATFAWIRLGIMLSGVSVSCVALYNKANGIGLVEGTRVSISRDLRSQLGDPNDLSLVLMFPVSFLAAEVFNKGASNFRRCLATIGLITAISGIIATQSRGGLLGICAVLGYFFYQRVRNIYITGAAGLIGIMLLAIVAGIGDRQSGGEAEAGVDASAMGRLYAWQAAFNMALSNPLTGVGIDNFYANYYFFSPHWDGKNHAVHSTWFQVLAETGFVGLVLFITLIVSIFRILRRTQHMPVVLQRPSMLAVNQSLQAGMLAFCVSGTFLTQAFTWPLYIILGLAVAFERYAQSQSIAQEIR
ncbi:O-antigen ligase family protein [Aestuariibacter salexigens]|uniref:O-antigen ligase family protein n=1 Tax=Aestuariibacter salexigens TaxID=226010 RepID=UPI00041E5FCA|nr:O-antigen ligase family protein [Aestuariibacter salexigens]